MSNAELSADNRTLRVRVPVKQNSRGGLKVVVAPEGEPKPRSESKSNEALVRALARAFRWRKLIESGVCGTIRELAGGEKVNASYVSRLLRLTLLAPGIVEAILAGSPPANLKSSGLMGSFPVEWSRQLSRVCRAPGRTACR